MMHADPKNESQEIKQQISNGGLEKPHFLRPIYLSLETLNYPISIQLQYAGFRNAEKE